MKGWYGKIKRRRGAKIARVAVMRRLAAISEQMVKNGEPYVIGGPSAGSVRRSRSRVAGQGVTHGTLRQRIFAGMARVSKGQRDGPRREAPAGGPMRLAHP